MTCRVAAGILLVVAIGVASAADPPPTPDDPAAVGRELDVIRDQLVALDIERALAALDAILGRPGLSDAARVAGYDLRAQAHAASDDLDAAEKDYRAILALQAAYAPNRDVTSKKAMARFAKIQAAMIGTIHVDLDPKDAALMVDDRPAALSASGSFPAVAGERRLRFAHRGFDTLDTTVSAVAGRDTLVKIRLVPNARTLVVTTDVDGVAVALDGVASGVTARSGADRAGLDAPATLTIEDVPIGEHEIRLAKSCFASETVQEIVSADLADRSPKILRAVAMRPARTRVTATGGQYEGELRVDGERVASLPLTSFAMCPGVRTLEVAASGRVVWSGAITAEESDLTLDLTPRPSAVLLGAAWPKAWSDVAAGWSLRERLAVPAGADLTTRDGWGAISLPPGTDLALGVIPGSGVAGDERIVLYGPALHEVEDRSAPPGALRPSWRVATLGAVLVDGDAGAVVLASVTPDGPAVKAGLLPGDRLVSIAGRAVADSASARGVVIAAGIRATLVLEIAPPSGAVRKVECVTSSEPRLAPPVGVDTSRVVRAAWASVDAAAQGPDAAIALANLAGLLEGSGRDAAAADAWRRVRSLGDGPLSARAAYAAGAGLQAGGKRAEAIEAFGQARSEGLAHGDAALAAAASDRLADLGVAPR